MPTVKLTKRIIRWLTPIIGIAIITFLLRVFGLQEFLPILLLIFVFSVLGLILWAFQKGE